jgi:hypothetical protein
MVPAFPFGRGESSHRRPISNGSRTQTSTRTLKPRALRFPLSTVAGLSISRMPMRQVASCINKALNERSNSYHQGREKEHGMNSDAEPNCESH